MPQGFPLQVLIADDHNLFRQGLLGLMKTRPDLVRVVGEAASGREVVELAESLRPDLILMDIYMPDQNGLQATREILEAHPDTSIVMLTSSEEDEHLFEALRIGAAGYLLKTLDARELFDLLSQLPLGEVVLTRSLASRILVKVTRNGRSKAAPADMLSERELEVLNLVARGLSNSDIAEALFISVNTVKVHIRNILQKLNVGNRTEATARALRSGLVTSTPQTGSAELTTD